MSMQINAKKTKHILAPLQLKDGDRKYWLYIKYGNHRLALGCASSTFTNRPCLHVWDADWQIDVYRQKAKTEIISVLLRN